LLAEGFAEFLSDDPACDVNPAARRISHNHADWPVRIVLRPSQRQSKAHGKAGNGACPDCVSHRSIADSSGTGSPRAAFTPGAPAGADVIWRRAWFEWGEMKRVATDYGWPTTV
jgi:hypothetical protein